MEIRYLGQSSFLLKGKAATVLTDPFDPATVGLKFPTVSADIVTVSHQHADHNNTKGIEGNPLVVDLPGEFEKQAVRVTGFQVFHDKVNGQERGKNVVYKIEIDDVSILHCGDLGHTFSDEMLEEIGQVNVLLIPVGGHFTIDSTEALQVIKQIDPSVVIPMHYKVDGMTEKLNVLAPVDDFLKKLGITIEEKQKKVVIKAEELTEEMKTIVMDIS